jgi:sulfotransferase famil protein
MLCSHEKKFIYSRTRKAASTSVEIFFQRFCVPQGILPESTDIEGHPDEYRTKQIITEVGIVGSRERLKEPSEFNTHMPISEIRNKLGREIFDAYYKFCTIRNPFDKIVSHFWWDLRGSFDPNESFATIKDRFGQFVVRNFGGFNDRSIFMIDGHLAVDEFIRYEHLATDLEKVCKRLNIDFRPEFLGTYKSGFRKHQEHFSDYYNPATKRLVEIEFSWEINRFNYSLRTSSSTLTA